MTQYATTLPWHRADLIYIAGYPHTYHTERARGMTVVTVHQYGRGQISLAELMARRDDIVTPKKYRTSGKTD